MIVSIFSHLTKQALWIPNFYTYVGLRFLLGIADTGMLTITTYKSEIFPASKRFVAVNLDFSFLYGAMLAPALSYLVPNWRHFCVMVSCFSFVAAVVIVFFVPESPMWLIRKKRYEEAYEILLTAAKRRGKEFDFDRFMEVVVGEDEEEDGKEEEDRGKEGEKKLQDKLHEVPVSHGLLRDKQNNKDDEDAQIKSPQSTGESFRSALRHRIYLLALLGVACTWSYNGFVYIGITFTYGTLAGERLFNFLLQQLVVIPAKCVGIATSYYFPRRCIVVPLYFMIGGVYLSLVVLRSVYGDVDVVFPLLRRVINISLLCLIYITWASTALLIQEVFPTLLRVRSYLIACFCGRVVAVCASFFPHFQKSHPAVLESVVGVAGLCLGLYVFLIMPETFEEPLPQTIDDLKAMKKRTRLLGRCCGGDGEGDDVGG